VSEHWQPFGLVPFARGSATVANLQHETAATNARPGGRECAYSRPARHERRSTRPTPPLCKQGVRGSSPLGSTQVGLVKACSIIPAKPVKRPSFQDHFRTPARAARRALAAERAPSPVGLNRCACRSPVCGPSSCGIHYWHARTVQSVGQRMADQVQVDRPNPRLPA
jgi:hypothetical protein